MRVNEYVLKIKMLTDEIKLNGCPTSDEERLMYRIE